MFDNDQAAIESLKIISYFRLANYWKPMESDKLNHIFKPNSKFENVLSLYNFDKQLRTIIFSAIQSIEIALRTKIIQIVSSNYGAFWFTNKSLFSKVTIFSKCLSNIEEELKRSKEDFLIELSGVRVERSSGWIVVRCALYSILLVLKIETHLINIIY